MIGNAQVPLPDSPEANASGSAASKAEERALPDAAGTDGQDGAPGEQAQGAFEDTLSFRSWDGEGASCDDTPPDGHTGGPAQRENAERGLAGSPEPPAERGSEAAAVPEGAGGSAGNAMSLMEHLRELRSRLVRVLIMISLGFFACYAVSEILFGELIKPLTASMPPGSKLIFTSIPEAFFVYMKVGFVASVFLTSPYTFYQIWAFVAPGLYEEERRNIVPLAAFSALFFLAGAAFCYVVVFPMAFAFFMSYATDTILPMPSLNEYLSFALKLLVAFGFIFEMPLFAFFLARIGVLTPEQLRRWRKYALLASVIVGALLTPPDVLSQLIMATAIVILYEVSIWIVALARKRPEKQGKKQDICGAARDADTPAQEVP